MMFINMKCFCRATKCGISNIHKLFTKLNYSVIPFPRNENDFFHSYMQNKSNYANFVKPHPKHLLQNIEIPKTLSGENQINTWEDFVSLSYLNESEDLNLENSKYTNNIRFLVQKLENLDDNMLKTVLFAFNLWPKTKLDKTSNFYILCNQLDIELCKRIRDFSIISQLEIADLWYHLMMSKFVRFNSLVIQLMLSNENRSNLTNDQFVYVLFLINLQREISSNVVSAQIENELTKRINSLSLEEIAIAVMSFFKTKTVMQNDKLLLDIIEITLRNIETIESLTFTALLKHFRFSGDIYKKPQMEKLLEESCGIVTKLSPIVGMHLCFLADNYKMFKPNLLKEVSDNVTRNIEDVRIKEMAKVAHSLSFFGYDVGKEFFNKLIEELQRENRIDEINHHPSCLITSLVALAHQNIYPEKLIDYAFSKSFIKLLNAKHNKSYNRDLSFLDCSIEIENPTYNGNRFNKALRLKTLLFNMAKIPQKQLRNMSFNERQTLDIATLLDENLGIQEGCMITHLLPHFSNPDILLVKEKESFVPIPSQARESLQGEILKPTNSRATWIALVLIGRQMYHTQSKVILGQAKTKIRQYEKLGFKAVPILLFTFVSYTKQTRKKFIKDILRN